MSDGTWKGTKMQMDDKTIMPRILVRECAANSGYRVFLPGQQDLSPERGEVAC
jgi:hypothetical protein